MMMSIKSAVSQRIVASTVLLLIAHYDHESAFFVESLSVTNDELLLSCYKVTADTLDCGTETKPHKDMVREKDGENWVFPQPQTRRAVVNENSGPQSRRASTETNIEEELQSERDEDPKTGVKNSEWLKQQQQRQYKKIDTYPNKKQENEQGTKQGEEEETRKVHWFDDKTADDDGYVTVGNRGDGMLSITNVSQRVHRDGVPKTFYQVRGNTRYPSTGYRKVGNCPEEGQDGYIGGKGIWRWMYGADPLVVEGQIVRQKKIASICSPQELGPLVAIVLPFCCLQVYHYVSTHFLNPVA